MKEVHAKKILMLFLVPVLLATTYFDMASYTKAYPWHDVFVYPARYVFIVFVAMSIVSWILMGKIVDGFDWITLPASLVLIQLGWIGHALVLMSWINDSEPTRSFTQDYEILHGVCWSLWGLALLAWLISFMSFFKTKAQSEVQVP